MIESTPVNIPRALYDRIQKLAQARRQGVDHVLAEVLETSLQTAEAEATLPNGANDEEDEVDREMAAFIAMHPLLRQTHDGHYVAIHHGRLIDADPDPLALYKRIDHRFPSEFVWISQVTKEPLRTLHFRSPRLIRE
jgi:hypothetical protein